MTFPNFIAGEVLRAQDMNAVGAWLIKTQAVGTGVSSVAVTGAFSSSYANYLVTWQGGTMSSSTAMKLQLGGVVTGYFGNAIYAPTYGGAGVTSDGDNNRTAFTYTGGGDSSGAQCFFYLSGPNAAQRTYVAVPGFGYGTLTGNYAGWENSTTQHTAFSLIPASGTMTGGTIRVYGLQN